MPQGGEGLGWHGRRGRCGAQSTFLNSRALKTAPKCFFFHPYRRARRRSILLSPGLATGGEYRLSRLRKNYHFLALKVASSPRWKEISPLSEPSSSSRARPSPEASSISSDPCQVKSAAADI